MGWRIFRTENYYLANVLLLMSDAQLPLKDIVLTSLSSSSSLYIFLIIKNKTFFLFFLNRYSQYIHSIMLEMIRAFFVCLFFVVQSVYTIHNTK